MSVATSHDFYIISDFKISISAWQTGLGPDSSFQLVLKKMRCLNTLSEFNFSQLPVTERKLKSDILFPDLYFIPFRSDCELYQDFAKKKFLRMGLEEEEIGDLFGYNSKNPKIRPEAPIDYSNKMFHKGRSVDITTLTKDEHLKILNEFGYEQLQQYNNLECVRSLHHLSTPTRKLHYPEPFIASPSFIHTDIGFIHVLHYQY